MLPKQMGVVALLCVLPGLASAASITINTFDPGDHYIDAIAGDVVETFETLGVTLGEGEVTNPFGTAVGTFATAGGTGGGGTVTGLPGNTGSDLALRDASVFGRVNTTPGGSWFLDSNDTHGMIWTATIGMPFNRILFTLTDGSDTGAFLRISAEGASVEQRVGGRLPNGNVSLVEILFHTRVSSATVELLNFTASGGSTPKVNDGFSVDDISISAVPLPAGLPLLLAGLGGLFLLRRRGWSRA